MKTTYADRSQPCVVCKDIYTTERNEKNEPLCAACSNDEYYRRKQNGQIVELRIDMTKVRQSTLMAIRAMIQKDIEEAAKPPSTPPAK